MAPGIGETGRNEWIEAPDTRGRRVALRIVLIAICLIAAAFIVPASLSAPAGLQEIALVPGL
jgi:hypothetical protein